MSIVAKKKIAIAKDYSDSIDEMPKTQLPEFLEARIGGKGKLTATEVAGRGGIADSYISELKSGAKDPLNMTAEAILRLARGMDESPLVVFQAVIGKLKTGIKDETLQQILEDFSQLDKQDRAELEFMIQQLRRMIRERLHDAQ